MSEINVTPFVDVMLVLLIIFMVTAPMMNNSGIEIDLPRADAPALDDSTEDQLVLEMTADGSIFLNEEPTTWETVAEQLAALAKLKPEHAAEETSSELSSSSSEGAREGGDGFRLGPMPPRRSGGRALPAVGAQRGAAGDLCHLVHRAAHARARARRGPRVRVH